MSQQPLEQLRAWLAKEGLDAFMVTQPQNRSYLSGWRNDDSENAGMLLVGQQRQILFTNKLYREIAEKEAAGWQVLIPEARQYAPAIVEAAKANGWKTIGFEASAITVAEFEKLYIEAQKSITFQAFEESYVDQIRQVKRDDELALLRRAIAITDETFAHICRWLEPGMTEKEVQFEISRYMVELGADGTAFDTIVASGPNASMPHAHAGQRRIQPGELITFDMGARYQGYCADMTRTICLGEPTEKRMLEIHDIVLKAMKTCEAGIYAGMTGKEADALARDVLEATGLGEYYVHGTGHGVGLQIHEGPSLSQHSADEVVLPAGSVVTVEPGVYIPGWSGARIEDCVLVTEHGCEVLTQSPTDLVIAR
ncbi:MAG TPA: Xaa-Pro peptidase family protein [Ktedonobacteraceae bacterium]|nr:Xaa-Pro peptidase family protein [Ktedonobacteraceae bacterium]